MPGALTLGLNQYTHSAAACLLDEDGQPLFLGEKERLTRKKHDGGDCAELIEHALEAVGAQREDIGLVVANNHLFRIDRFHRDLPWNTALFSYRESYLSPFNLLPEVPRRELSHHLAHAWSVLPYCPFDEGLIVVMDGMGSTHHEMSLPGERYHSEFSLEQDEAFRSFPAGVESGLEAPPAFGWREGETVFRVEERRLRRYWKRWIAESTPPLLHNYGFENMSSLGAVYSRVASHIFGDWNHCGKVMGLAPMAASWAPELPSRGILRGPLETLEVDWDRLRQEAYPNQWAREEARPGYARLAADMQQDLEAVVLEFLGRLREETGATHLALVGGVALNSTLNGRICREAGFAQVWIPPYPGDQGIAVGCAAFGHAWRQAGGEESHPVASATPPLSPYGGAPLSAAAIDHAVATFEPWLEEAELGSEALEEVVAEAIADGQVVALCHGRSEFGPRALGHRSLLADPRDASMVERLNLAVKKREAYRPFAPTVLAEEVAAFFDGATPSPYMSLTVPLNPEQATLVPAVVHADGSARLQTLEEAAEPAFAAIIKAFHRRTGIPMVLNTSFNIRGEPMVESAEDALWSFLRADIDLLVLGERLFRRRAVPAVLPLATVAHSLDSWHAETVSDAHGDTMSVRVMARGETVDLAQLELGVLEACAEPTPLAELLEAFAAEWEVAPEDTLEAVLNLHRHCLMALQFPAD